MKKLRKRRLILPLRLEVIVFMGWLSCAGPDTSYSDKFQDICLYDGMIQEKFEWVNAKNAAGFIAAICDDRMKCLKKIS
jgi:hypothetical protein